MSCATLPTATQFGTQLVTTNSLSTSFSTLVTSVPGKVETSTSTICLDSNTSDASTCSSTSITVITTTGPGSTSTTSVPVTVTVPITLTTSSATKTLFSTTCSSTTTTTTPTTTPTPTSDTPTSSSPAPSPTSDSTPFTSLSTPPPVVSTFASSSTLPNGSVLTTDFVVTETLPPSPVVVTPSLNHGGGGGGGPSAKTAPIVGGVVGGVIGLLALLGGIWFLWRRSKRWNDIFDQTEDQERRPRMSLDGEDVAPRPYHYGLVGHSPSPPGSPPLGRVNSGHSPSNSLSMLNPPVNQHSRSSSALTVPSPGSMSRSMSDLSPVPVTVSQASHVRPNLSTSSSIAASTRPLLERAVNQTRPPSSWSVGGQSVGPGLDGQQGVTLSPRPRSAGENMQSTVGSSGASLPPRSSPATEKHRLRASLPLGAAAPTPPAPTIPAIPGPRTPAVQSPREGAPPLTPRNPKRPSSAKNQDTSVLVHVDGGPAGSANSQQTEGRIGNEPPAYSPT